MDEDNIDLGQEVQDAPEEAVLTEETVEETQEQVAEDNSQDEQETSKNSDDLPRGVKRRFDKLTRDKYEQQARITQLENYIKQQEAKANEKKREEYSEEEWYEHKAELKARELFEEYTKTQEQNLRKMQEAREHQNRWEKKVNSFNEDIPDYNEVIAANADVLIPKDVLRTINESDVGPKIAYHLAKHPEDADKLWDMDTRGRDRFITRLEIRLEDKSFAQKKEITKASPTPKAKGGSSSNNNLENLSIEEWMKQRNKKVRG